MKPWTVKYRPETLEDITGQNKAVQSIRKFIQDFKKNKKKALLLYGPPGSGKTSAVHALAKENNFEILEINASDIRNKGSINDIVGHALKQQSLFAKEKIILIDEVDGIAGQKDRGGLKAITDLVKKARFPVILTANDPWDRKFQTLRKYCQVVELHKLRAVSVKNVLKDIAQKEDIHYEEKALKSLAYHVNGDLRGAIIDLQTLSQGQKFTEEELEDIAPRKKTESIFNALTRVFKTTQPEVALKAFDNINEDFDELFLWLDHNLPKEYTRPKDLYRAYEKLSKADIFKRRIHRRQHWRFLVYINALLTAGIALSKDEKYQKFVKYQPTKRIFKMWIAKQKNKKKQALAEKLGHYLHSSKNDTLQDTLPYFVAMFNKSKDFQKKAIHGFDLNKDEINLIKKIA